ncbi:MAG: ATP-binding cassette domain-containing protein [Campylobacterota bacterium]|nr:ATP-binding cassette domain-containing protein [Campylobacterota bacterium]
MPSFVIEDLKIYNQKSMVVNLFKKIDNPIIIDSTLALVGMSGSGKSLTLKTILNMLPADLKSNFIYKNNFELNANSIGFIPQNPFTSLSPMTKIIKQFFCPDEQIDKLLKLVDLDLDFKYKFPSQLSGGQLQRVVIAIALSNNPKILLLDEPTTALDNKTKNTILNLLKTLQKEFNFIMIFVSHDIESIKNICKDIAILKDGMIYEYGKIDDILNKPETQYTKQLLESSFNNREFRK